MYKRVSSVIAAILGIFYAAVLIILFNDFDISETLYKIISVLFGLSISNYFVSDVLEGRRHA